MSHPIRENPSADYGARIFFMHVPKTGGSTVNRFLAAQVPRDRAIVQAQHGFSALDPSDYDLISGHLSYPDAMAKPGLEAFCAVTVLRDPVAQLASHLDWVALQVRHWRQLWAMRRNPEIRALGRKLNGLDLSDPGALDRFLSASETPRERAFFDNCQLRYLLGIDPSMPVGAHHVSDAVARLDRFACVGVTEDLRATLECLAARFNMRAPGGVRRANRNHRRIVNPRDARLRAVLAAHTEPERQVYVAACERFRQQAAALAVPLAEPENAAAR